MENASMEKEPTVNRYRIFKRRSGIYFLEDNKTRKQESLRTLDKTQAERVAFARNESERIPAGHRQIGIGYLQAGDPKIRTRTWSEVADAFCAQPVKDSTRRRKLNAMKDPALRPLMSMILIETLPEHLLDALAKGTVSTNCFLRKLHNLAKKLKWLPEEILTRGTWPVIRHKQNRAITREEFERVLSQAIPTRNQRVTIYVKSGRRHQVDREEPAKARWRIPGAASDDDRARSDSLTFELSAGFRYFAKNAEVNRGTAGSRNPPCAAPWTV
jgi:hypothetical protein